MVNLNIPGYWPPISVATDPLLFALQLVVYVAAVAVFVLAVNLVRQRVARRSVKVLPVVGSIHADTCAAEPQSRAELIAAERDWARKL